MKQQLMYIVTVGNEASESEAMQFIADGTMLGEFLAHAEQPAPFYFTLGHPNPSVPVLGILLRPRAFTTVIFSAMPDDEEKKAKKLKELPVVRTVGRSIPSVEVGPESEW
jgi:hypothetical protein